MLHVHILASGSKGNAALIEGPEGLILVDCGISWRQVRLRAAELGLDLNTLAGAVVTHEHGDHVSGLSVTLKHVTGPRFATAGTVSGKKYLPDLGFTLIDRNERFELAGVSIQAFPTSHDVNDPVAFSYTDTRDGDKVALCSDTGVLTPEATTELCGCRILGLEANHDLAMLKRGPYSAALKARVSSNHGHLSNEQAASALPTLISEHTETVVALHLSQENNIPSLAIKTLASAVGAERTADLWSEARTPDGRLTICAAGQDKPLSIW